MDSIFFFSINISHATIESGQISEFSPFIISFTEFFLRPMHRSVNLSENIFRFIKMNPLMLTMRNEIRHVLGSAP